MPVDRTFDTLERSRAFSRPVELYTVRYGSTVYRFTSAAQDLTFSTVNYRAVPLKRNSPTLNPRERKSTRLTIEAPTAEPPFDVFIGVQPATRMEVRIVRIQQYENLASPIFGSPEPPAAPLTAYIIFEGYVNSASYKDRTVKLLCNPFTEQFSRAIPRIAYQGLCNHVLYDAGCSISKASFLQTGLCSGVVGDKITINGFSGVDFVGGYIATPSNDDWRMVLEQNTDTFTLLLPFSENPVGKIMSVYMGCDHKIATCRDKFSNVVNFGGYPYIPSINPYTQQQFTKI